MQIGHSRATNYASITLTQSGSGGSVSTPIADILNGRPQDVTRLIWQTTPVSGSRAITDYMTLDFEFNSAIVPGMIGLFGFNPAPGGSTGVAASADGFDIRFFGRRPGDTAGTYPYSLGGTSQSQKTVVRDDGSSVIICMLPSGLSSCAGFRMQLFNNQNGSVMYVPGQAVDLGDFWVSPSFELDIDGDWKVANPPDKMPVSVDNQPWPRPYPPGRVLTGKRSLLDFNTAWISGTNPSWQKLRTLCGNGQSTLLVPRWSTDGTFANLNQSWLNAMAMMGICNFTELDRTAGDTWTCSFDHHETPALSA